MFWRSSPSLETLRILTSYPKRHPVATERVNPRGHAVDQSNDPRLAAELIKLAPNKFPVVEVAATSNDNNNSFVRRQRNARLCNRQHSPAHGGKTNSSGWTKSLEFAIGANQCIVIETNASYPTLLVIVFLHAAM